MHNFLLEIEELTKAREGISQLPGKPMSELGAKPGARSEVAAEKPVEVSVPPKDKSPVHWKEKLSD